MSTYHNFLKRYLHDLETSLFTATKEYSLHISTSSDSELSRISKGEIREISFLNSFSSDFSSESQSVDPDVIILPSSSASSVISCESYKSDIKSDIRSVIKPKSIRKFTIENLHLYLNTEKTSKNDNVYLENSNIHNLNDTLEHELGPLNRIIHNHKLQLTGAMFVHWFSDIFSGLSYLHNELQIVHFTINSKNLFLRNTAFGIVCELANFGVDNELVDENYSIKYLAPELLVPDFQYYNVTAKSDVYSVGNVMWEFLQRENCYNDVSDEFLRTEIIDYRYILNLENRSEYSALSYILDRCHSWHAFERADSIELQDIFKSFRFEILNEADKFYERGRRDQDFLGGSRYSKSSTSTYKSVKSLRLSSVRAISYSDLVKDKRPTKFDLIEKNTGASAISEQSSFSISTVTSFQSPGIMKSPIKFYRSYYQIIMLILVYLSFLASFKLLLSHQ